MPPTADQAAAGRLDERLSPRAELAVLAAIALALRLPALVADRHLTFDDGVFNASAVAMREGGVPFRDVFSSQAPLHLVLVRAADLLGGQARWAPRLLPVLSGVVAVLLVTLVGRRLAGRAGGRAAGGLLAVSGSFTWVSSALHADAAALAFALGALLALLRWDDEPGPTRAVVLGALTGAALATKSVVLPVVVPIGVLLLRRRAWRDGTLAAVVAAAVGLAAALPFGLERVVDQAVTYHAEAAEGRAPVDNVRKVASTLADRDPLLLVLAVVAAGLLLVQGRRRSTAPDPDARDGVRHDAAALLVGTWLAASAALLLYIHPLWRPHLALLAPPLALLVGLHRPPARVLLAAVAVLVPLQLVHVRDVTWPPPYPTTDAAIVDAFRTIPEDRQAISDEPGLVWAAGRATPPDLVDTSQLRIDSGRITEASLLDAAGAPEVCALAVTSGRFGRFDGLATGLVDLGYAARPLPGARGPDALYVRSTGGCGSAPGTAATTSAASDAFRMP